jgi:hypothetical protein
MKPVRRFGFGHAPAPARAAHQPARHADEITAPLPVFSPRVSPVCQERPTLPLADAAAPVAPVLPFRAPAAPQGPPQIAPEATRPPGPRRPVCVHVAIAAVSVALYSALLVALVSPRRAVEAPVSAAPAAAAPAPTSGPVPSTAPVPNASAGAPAPSASASPPASVAPPPRSAPAPARVARPPAPAPTRTSQPVSDVRNPWSYD